MHAAALKTALQPLAGLRALANIAIMVFHHVRLRRHLGLGPLNKALEAHPVVLQTVMHGWLGLDIMFLLCGFHAALTLVPALGDRRRSVKQAVLQYYWRRAWRIAPAFWVSLAVTHFLMLRGRASAAAIPEADSALFHYPEAFCPRYLWHAAAFLSHWLPGGGCGLQLWSMGTQMAFYAVAPLLLAAARPRGEGFRRRAAIGAGLAIAVSTMYRAWAVRRFDMALPIIPFGSHIAAENERFAGYQLQLHYSLVARFASLATGALLALPFTDGANVRVPAPGNGEGGSPTFRLMPAPVAAIGCGLAFAALSTSARQPIFAGAGAPTWPREEGWLYMVTMIQGGPIINAVLAFAIAVAMTGAGPGGRALHRLLSGRLWALLSELSYSAYLYHEQVRFWLWRYGALPSGLTTSASDFHGLAIEQAATLVATFAVAAASYALVEQPAAALGRRLEPKALRSSGSGGGNSSESKA